MSLISPFSDEARRHLGLFLEEHGFTQVAERYDPQSFGNAFVDFCSAELCIRLIRDRGQVYADVRRVNELHWSPLHLVLPSTRSLPPTLERIAECLEPSLGDITKALAAARGPSG
jgi:hypothetical protein